MNGNLSKHELQEYADGTLRDIFIERVEVSSSKKRCYGCSVKINDGCDAEEIPMRNKKRRLLLGNIEQERERVRYTNASAHKEETMLWVVVGRHRRRYSEELETNVERT
ncbi:hypothetical protein Tco_1533314 [Tanacetum coccineum]